MRCKACDDRLTAREATTKGEATGEYMDLCSKCLSTIADQIGLVESPINAGEEERDSDEEVPTTDLN